MIKKNIVEDIQITASKNSELQKMKIMDLKKFLQAHE